MQVKRIKDENGIALADEEKIRRRWETYFERLLNEENPRRVFEDGRANEGLCPKVTKAEVKQALKKMKNEKATGPDTIPGEIWKSLDEKGINI